MGKVKASVLVKKAASQIGTKESPSNSNKQKYGKWYGMNGEPWCDMFVSWCAAQVGQSDIGKYAYCPYHVNHFKKNGQWLGRTKNPKAGDIVFFGNSSGVACHVGIVEKKLSSSRVQTIEGNTSTGKSGSQDNGGCVARRTRDYGSTGSSWYILGFARPNYAGTKTVKKDTSTTKKTNKLTVTAKSGLNLRKSATTSAKILAVIPYNTKIEKVAVKGDWYKVTYNGKTGYVYGSYVK